MRVAGGSPLLPASALWAIAGLAALSLACSNILVREPAIAVNRIAYVGLDQNIHVIRPDGSDQQTITASGTAPAASGNGSRARGLRTTFNWPAWSPDGRRLAYTGLAEGEAASLWSYDLADQRSLRLFTSQDEVPFYLFWSPNGRQMAFLVQRRDSLSLLLAGADMADSARPLAHGAPLYLMWAPDSQQLLLHIGGSARFSPLARLSVANAASAREELLLHRPADFRSPAWSPDGHLMALAAQDEAGRDALLVMSADGEVRHRIADAAPSIAFVWSPARDEIAYSRQVEAGRATYDGITIATSDGSSSKRVADVEVLAFFWSPDGSHLAYVSLDEREGRLAWHVVARSGEGARRLATFLPTRDAFSVFTFFDQYAASSAVWSPAGDALVYAGMKVGSELPQVFVVPADGSAEPRPIASGTLAFWSRN